MEIVVYTPVFKYNRTGKTVRHDRNLANIYGYIDSTFTKMEADTIQAVMNRRADIYASFDKLGAFKTHMAYLNKQTIEIDDDEISEVPFVGMYIEKDGDSIQYDESYPKRSFTATYKGVSRNIAIHYYNNKSYSDKQLNKAERQYNWFIKQWLDALDLLEYNIAPSAPSFYKTVDWAKRTVDFFDIVYRGANPVSRKEYEIVDLDKKRKTRSAHYVYTLAYNGTVYYVGYTTKPKSRLQQHIYCQTNPYLKLATDTYGIPEMKVVEKLRSMGAALRLETELIQKYGDGLPLANIKKNPYGPRYI